MSQRVIQFLLILGMVAGTSGTPARLPVRAADRGTSVTHAPTPPASNTPDPPGPNPQPRGCGGVTCVRLTGKLTYISANPLPRGCGGVTPPGEIEAACCINGFVYLDGRPVGGAEVQIQNQGGVTSSVFTPIYSDTETPSYYQLSLSAPPLNVRAGERIIVTARYHGLTHSLSYVVRPGGQRVDVVLPNGDPEGYLFERQIWGQAKTWQFNDPRGLAVDGAGQIYVVDRGNARVLVFDGDELVVEWGELGDQLGQFLHSVGIAVDDTGNVYVADTENDRIQKRDAAGLWTAWDGSDSPGGQFTRPEGVAVDGDGKVYVADKGSDRVMKFSGDGAWLGTFDTTNIDHLEPIDISVDPGGNIYVLGRTHIYKFDSSGVLLAASEESFDPKDPVEPGGISADAGAVYVTYGSAIYLFDAALNLTGTWQEKKSWGNALFNRSGDITTDKNGHLYATDTLNHRILQLDNTNGEAIDSWGDYGHARGELSKPEAVAVGDGIVYVADTHNDRIQVFSSDGAWQDIWGGAGTADGEFRQPGGIALDGSGNIYVADTENHRVQKCDTKGKCAVLNGPDPGGGLPMLPHGIAVDQAGNIYVSDTENNRVWKREATGQWTRLDDQGTATGEFLGSKGIAVDPDSSPQRIISPTGKFLRPKGIAVDPDGNIYVADSNNYRIQKYDVIEGWTVWRSEAQFIQPDGVSVDSRGRVYVADAWNGRIRKFTSDGALLTELGGVGAGEGQFGGHGSWLGIDVEDAEDGGRLYVADRANNRIQIFEPRRPIATINYLSATYFPTSGGLVAYGMGQDSDETPDIVAYRWTSNLDGVLGNAATLEISATQLITGVHDLSFAVQDSEGYWSDPISVRITVGAEAEWTMLLYLAGDYADGGRLLDTFNHSLDVLRRSFHNQNVRIAVQIDGHLDGGTRRLLIAPGSPTGSPQVETFPLDEQAMDDPEVLAEFVRWGQSSFPAEHYYLAIANHGQGIQGMAWDSTSDPSGGAYLTVKELGQALNADGVAPIDVLHLDACTMDLLEVAYEVNPVGPQEHQQVGIVIASQYLGWDYFAYDDYQGLIATATSPRDLARRITARYAELAERDGHPYTIAALDLQRMQPAREALDQLAAKLIGEIGKGGLSTAALDVIRQASQHFDSNGNFVNDQQDIYVDLVDWTQRIHDSVSSTAVQNAADALRAKLTGPHLPLIITSKAKSNALPIQYANGASIDLDRSNGVSIFYPQRQDTEVFHEYIDLFSFASDSSWPDFLEASSEVCPECEGQPLPGPQPPIRGFRVFLPIVLR